MRTVRCVVACLAGGLPSSLAGAEPVTARMSVSAQVLPHVSLEPVAPVTTFVTVTAADVENGYVDVAHHYTLRTNAPGRVRLRLQPQAAYAEEITVEGFGATVQLQGEAVELSPAPGRDIAFALRLWLLPGLAPGDYPAAVHVVALVD